MASQTKSCDVVVIYKTKLSETDTIVRCISSGDTLVEFVAKSARKPGNTFSNRLDLFTSSHVTYAICKGLDIVREARAISFRQNLRSNYKKFLCASSISEIIWRISFDGSVAKKTYSIINKAFDLINNLDGRYVAIMLATIFKIYAMEGVKPNFKRCSICQKAVRKPSAFSYLNGGVICHSCEQSSFVDYYAPEVFDVIERLIYMRFDDVNDLAINKELLVQILDIAENWSIFHLNYSIKSFKLLTRELVSE